MIRYTDECLWAFNTFGMRANASELLVCESEDEVRYAVKMSGGRRFFVLGGGSNVLFVNDFAGLIIHPHIVGLRFVQESQDRIRLRVGAGEVWDSFVNYCTERGYFGVENLSGIPGHVGATPVQNIGAYGAEVGHFISRVYGISTETGERVEISGDECRFGYRDSVFKNELLGKVVVCEVEYELHKQRELNLGYGDLQRETLTLSTSPTPYHVRQAVLRLRDRKLPNPHRLGNGGSFFKNPVVDESTARRLKEQYPDMPQYASVAGSVKLAAGWLIDQCGWKGKGLGRAGVYERQALILVNLGGAEGREIVALAEAVISDVEKKFGVRLEPEVNIIY